MRIPGDKDSAKWAIDRCHPGNTSFEAILTE